MKSEAKEMSLNIFECPFLDQYSEGLTNEKRGILKNVTFFENTPKIFIGI